MYYSLGILVFLVVVFFIIVRCVYGAVDREFRNLARAAEDEHYRKTELERLDAALAPDLPVPEDVQPLPKRKRTGGAAVTVLLAMGGLLMLGAPQARPEEQSQWLMGGVVVMAAAVVVMLLSLRRRKAMRLAGLLRARADLRRLDGDARGAADDLLQLIRLTPWDDTAWAELSDDFASLGETKPAFDAICQAVENDSAEPEYKLLQASLALQLKEVHIARQALEEYKKLCDTMPVDPRATMYEAELGRLQKEA